MPTKDPYGPPEVDDPSIELLGRVLDRSFRALDAPGLSPTSEIRVRRQGQPDAPTARPVTPPPDIREARWCFAV